MQGKVLVLGQDSSSFLAVIRSLGRQNLQVHVAWCADGWPSLHSKYIAKVQNIPAYSPDDDTWKQVFIAVMQNESYDLIIPTNDRTIIPLHINRTELGEYGQIYLVNEKAYDIANDKIKTGELARSLNIPIPREILITNHEVGADYIIKEFGLPVIIKPRTSYSELELSNKQYVSKAYNREQLASALELKPLQSTLVAQKYFAGTGVGVDILADNGEILCVFQHARIHENLMVGASSYRKSADVDVSLLEASRKIIKALNYTGVAMIEFRVNHDTGEWVLLEINARFWGSLPLAVAAGADFPYYLYQLLVDNKRKFNEKYKTGIYCRNYVDDLKWFRQNLTADRKDPTLSTVPLSYVFKEPINLLTFKEYNDTLILEDPMPGLVEIFQYIRRVFLKISNTVVKIVLSLPVIRRFCRDKV